MDAHSPYTCRLLSHIRTSLLCPCQHVREKKGREHHFELAVCGLKAPFALLKQPGMWGLSLAKTAERLDVLSEQISHCVNLRPA